MRAFSRLLLIGTIAFIVAQALPLAWLNFALCWAIIIAVAYRYPHFIPLKVQAMNSPVGFAVGMGAALGALINTVGMCCAFLLHLLTGAIEIANTNSSTAQTAGVFSGITAAADLFQIFGAPFLGAVLGAVGGLIGGSTMPRISTPSPLITNDRGM